MLAEQERSCLKKAGGAGRYMVWRRRKAGSKVWVTAISSRYPHLFPDLPALLMYTRVTYCLADSCVGRRVLGS